MLQTSVKSPLSIRNSNSAWKFPERLVFCGSSSRGPLRAMLFCPQKIIVLKRDFKISRFLLICCWSKLLICWSIGTDSLVIFLRKFSITITAKLCISHFPPACLVKREMADVQSVSGELYNFSSLFEFRRHWTPKKKKHGKQNAPSKYLASQGNLFSHLHTKWRLEFEPSTDTGKSIAHLVSTHFLWTWACRGLNMSWFPWKPSLYRTENSPPSDRLDRLEPWFIKSKSCLPP